MARAVSLDEELFRMPSKTEHLAMTRSELFLVHRRRLICVPHVRFARARTRTSFSPVHVRSVTLNLCLSAYVCSRLRFALLLGGSHFFRFRRGSSLRFLGLLLRLLRLRLLA